MKTLFIRLSQASKHLFLLSGLLAFSISKTDGQVTGTKTIGIDYPTLAAAITDLNTNGISGTVTINVPAGYTETAPTGGYLLGSATLNSSTSSASSLTFQKSGTGVNPLLTAPVGTSVTTDGIFIIRGTDYVTINRIDLTESPLNITPLTQMEWGYSLVKLQNTAPFDGCHDVIIKNCTITLNQANPASTGIYSGDHIATDTTSLAITATTDATNNCTFNSNSITNVNTGFSLKGYISAPSPYSLYDQNNAIGGATAGLGNIITNFGGTTTAAYGIYLAGQNNAAAVYNTITSATVPGSGVLKAIFHGLGTNSSFTATNNTIQMNASTGAIYGIANGTGTANSGISGTGTITITNNTFQNYSFTAANSATNYFCLYNFAGTTAGWDLGSLVINNNKVQGMSNLNATSTIYLFYNYYCNANDVRFNNNKINGMFRSSAAGNTYCYYNYYGSPTSGADSVVGDKITNVSSPYGLYCIYDYMGTTTRDRIILNDTVANDTASKNSTFYSLYSIYSYYGNNITIQNCLMNNLYGTPTNSGYVYGIYRYNGNNATVSNNTFTNNRSYYYYGIYSSSAAVSSQVHDNVVNNITVSTGGGYGVYSNSTGTNTVYNNSVQNISGTGSATLYGIYNSGGSTEDCHNNTVYNISTIGGSVYGFYNSSGTSINVHNNNIGKISNTGTTGSVYGLYASGGTTLNFYQNIIDTLTTAATSGNGYGIYESGPANFNCYKNKVSYVSANGTGGSANGMYLNSGIVNAYNNLIGDLRTPAYSSLIANSGTQLVGIYCGSGSNYYIYYNTVDINATSTGTNFGSTAIYASTAPNVTLRNNVFVNTSTPNGTGMVAAYRRSSTTLTTYQSASNNNLFYAGTPAVNKVILWDGTTGYTTLAAYKALVTPRDGSSVTENVTFQSLTGIASTFLHPSTAVATQIESNGVNITGITDDIYGTIRAGNTGYTGSGVAPDLGAVEDNYIALDLSAPSITYTPLVFTCTTGDRTFTAALTDVTGVPTSGILVPRVYYKKNSGAWFSNAGTLTSGTSTSGTWSFTIVASDMGGLSISDTVYYFVIAQDLVTPPNVGSNPSGVVASDVNTITAYPVPNYYLISTSLSGSYNVGATGAYPTITAAVAAYNTACITGPVTFLLTDATYPAETFPITINSNFYSSPANTLTIRPATGVSPAITGSSASAIFVLNGADHVIIDGSNSPVTNSVCPAVAASRNMTITNTNTSATSAVIWLQTATGSDSATNNVIRNCNVVGSGNTFTLFGIGSGGPAISYTSLGINNNNNRIENNSISATQTGIYSMGASAANKNSGTVINQNLLNGTAPNNMRNNGILVGFEDNITISGNNIANITNSISNDIVGIDLGFGNNAISTGITTGNDVTNATVTNNKLDNLKQTNTYSCLGIAVAGVTSGTNTIANNMISGLLSNGTGGDFSSSIFIGGASGGTTNVFYNSIDVTGTLTGASYPSFAISISGSNPSVNLKNNIFVNHGSTGSALIYAIGLAYTTYSNLSSDRNDFFSVGANMGVVGSLSGGGTNQPTLAAWQATTGNDANSKNIDPTFASPTDLHVTPVEPNIPLMDAGTPVSVTNDFDCNPRSATTPDIGLNEFNIPLCTSVTAGTASPAVPVFCGSGTTTISLSGTTVGIGIVYQWESSPDSTSWTVISGATNITYTPPVITSTTFYRAIVTCSYSGANDSATTKVIIHPLPVISVTPDGGTVCTGESGLSLTASGATGYTWLPATGLSSTTGPNVIATPTTTTTYTVTGTDVFGCQNTHVFTVTVNITPTPVTVSPPTDVFCSGNSVALTASSTITGPGSALVQDFNSGLSGWTIDNTGTVSTYPDVTWTIHGDGYINELGTYHSPDHTAFILTNSDTSGPGIAVHSILISPTFSLAGYTAATLTFQHAYEHYFADVSANVEISTDGGTTWSVVHNYASAGLSIGSTSSFVPANFDLSSYLGMANLKIRFNYQSVYGFYWALDNIKVSGTVDIPETNITWAPFTGLYNDAGLTSPYTGTAATTVYAAPTAFGTPTVNTYTATASNGICTSTGTSVITVNPMPDAGTIAGPSGVCVGSSITLTDTASGGTWSISNAHATITTGGVVTGVTAGTDTVTYTYTNVCGTATTTAIISINPLPFAGTITGPASVCVASTITLSDPAPGGTWSSSNSSATVSGIGVVTGVSAGAVTISYTVTNVCGTDVATKDIIVNPLPYAGTITGSTFLCSGSSNLLTDSALGGVWSASNPSATVVPFTPGTAVVSGVYPGTDTIIYTFTNVCGTDITTITVTVNATPDPGIISGPASVCTGASVTVTDPVGGGDWSSSNAHATVSTSGVVTGVTAGVDTISYTVTGTCGTGTATKTITVDPSPNAGTTTGPSVVCTGATITLTDTAAGGVWSSSNPSATVSGGVVTGVSTGTAIISYTVANSCGSASAILPVAVNPSPGVFTITGGGAYCSGGSGVPIGLSGSETGISYRLYNGGLPTGSPLAGTGSALDFGLHTAAGTYTVIATGSGCPRTMAGTATIVINPTTPPSVSITTGMGDTVCTGMLTTFTAVPVNGGPSPAYQWSVNGVNTGTGNTYSYTPSNGDVVRVKITSTPCAMPDTASSSIVMTVVPYATPSVTITANPGTSVCHGTEVTFTAHPALGGPAPTFRWTVNGINVATGLTFTYVPSNGDNVYCLMRSNFPCRLADSVFSNHIIMSVSTLLLPTVTIVASPGTNIAAGQTDTLTAVVTNGGPSPSYQWKINGAPIAGATSAVFIRNTLFNGDVVSCTVISSGACSGNIATDSVTITVHNVGVQQVTANGSDIRLIPNPNKGTFAIRGTLGTLIDEEVTIEITDMLGQVIYKAKATAKKGQLDEQIILNNNPANGMYILNLRTDTGNTVFHFVLEQ